MRVALYIRVSTDEQASSAETQERGALAWCAAQGHNVVATYRDIGHSGAEWVTRPNILALQIDAKRTPRPWDLVVVRDTDRLGRDGVRLPVLLSDLRDAGIAVVESSTGQTVAMDGYALLVSSVRACVAQIERENIAHRVRTAHATQHAQGRVVGGSVYGYRNIRAADGVRYEIDQDEADVVREIYARVGKGEGVREIAHALNGRRLPPPSAGTRGTGSWSPSAVYQIITSERYKGTLTWGATAKRYKGGTQIRSANNDVVRVEMPELAIVSPETWEAAQHNRATRAAAAGKHVHRGHEPRYLLVGHAMCAACEGPIAVIRTKQGQTTVPAYTCAWHRDRGICPVTWRRWIERVDEAVRAWLLRDVIDQTVVTDAVIEARRALASGEPDPREADLRAEERELSGAVGRLVLALEHAGDVAEIVARLRDRRSRLDVVRAELGARASSGAVIPVTLDQMLGAAVRRMRDGLTSSVAEARAVLSAVLVGRLKFSWEGPGGRVWIEGRAELGGVIRAALTRGILSSPDGIPHTPRPAVHEVDSRIAL